MRVAVWRSGEVFTRQVPHPNTQHHTEERDYESVRPNSGREDTTDKPSLDSHSQPDTAPRIKERPCIIMEPPALLGDTPMPVAAAYASAWLNVLSGGVGALSSVLVCVAYYAYPDLRSSWRRLVLFLALTDFMQGVFAVSAGMQQLLGQGRTMTSARFDTACYIEAIFGMWSAVASFLWTACLSGYLAAFMASSIPLNALQSSVDLRVTLLMCVVCFGYPTVIDTTILAAGVNISRGVIGANASATERMRYGCFIDEDEPVIWKMLALYGPLWFSMLTTVVCSGFVWQRVSQHIGRSETRLGQRNLRMLRVKVLLIPITFLFQRGPETVDRALAYAMTRENLAATSLGVALNLIQALCNPIQGLSTSIIFIWSSPAYYVRIRNDVWGGKCCGASRRLLLSTLPGGGSAQSSMSSGRSWWWRYGSSNSSQTADALRQPLRNEQRSTGRSTLGRDSDTDSPLPPPRRGAPAEAYPVDPHEISASSRSLIVSQSSQLEEIRE